MVEPKSPPTLSIVGANLIATKIATMQFLVGFGLTRWHFVEQDLTMIYLSLVCGENAPVDGALSTFSGIKTVEAKIDTVKKTLAQVLYQDEFADFRTAANKKLNRISIINGKRNNIAHGMATTLIEGDEEVPYFLPFYNLPGHFREKAYVENNVATSVIKRQPKLTVEELRELVDGLQEGVELSRSLLADLIDFYERERPILEGATRMALDCGLPYDRTPPPAPQGKDTAK